MKPRRNRRQQQEPFAFWEDDAPDDIHIRRERNRAKDLRKSRWWQQKAASGCCHYCGKDVGVNALTMDHLLPLSRGGLSSKTNIVPCCKECNTLKKSMMPIEWDQYCRKTFTQE